MAEESDDREWGFIVISMTLEEAKKFEGCKVIPYGDVYPAIYRQVYGPSSRRGCEKWVAANCAQSNRATS